MAYEANLSDWYVGEDRVFDFTIYDEAATDAEIEAGTAAKEDITGWTFEWILRERPASKAALLTVTPAVEDIDTVNSKVSVRVTRALSLPLLPGLHHHTLRRSNGGGSTVLSEGTALLEHAATR